MGLAGFAEGTGPLGFPGEWQSWEVGEQESRRPKKGDVFGEKVDSRPRCLRRIPNAGLKP